MECRNTENFYQNAEQIASEISQSTQLAVRFRLIKKLKMHDCKLTSYYSDER